MPQSWSELGLHQLSKTPKQKEAAVGFDKTLYHMLYSDVRHGIRMATKPISPDMDPLRWTIEKWQEHLSTLPIEQKNILLARLAEDMGISPVLP